MTLNDLPPIDRLPRVILVDADEDLLGTLSQQLGDKYNLRAFANPSDALEEALREPADLVILEQATQESAQRSFIAEIKRASPGTKIAIMTPFVSLDTAISTMDSVEIDFILTKPVELDQLNHVLRKAWADRKQELERESLLARNRRSIVEFQRVDGGLETGVRARTDELIRANESLESALVDAQSQLKSISKVNESLNLLATIDPLTGLHNRREFDRRLAEEWGRYQRNRRPLSLIMADIDYFKKVNDTHGHECGDRVLHALAGLMRSCVRIQDTVCRFGGEEFIALLPDTHLEAAIGVAEDLRQRVARHTFHCHDVTLHIEVSLGVAGALQHRADSPENLVNLTDQALYRAKEDGRNRTVSFDPSNPRKVLPVHIR